MRLLPAWIAAVFGTSRYERIKILLLASSYFSIIGCYTILRELRDSLFVSLVGCEYIQHAQIVALVSLFPLLFLYARLVDRFSRYQLLYGFTALYGVGGLVAAVLLAHDTIGIVNTATGVNRLFGWTLYVFIEGFSAFVISLFLAVVNSVTPPKQAPESYSLILAGSKVGGIAAAAFAWWFLSVSTWSSVVSHQLLLVFSSGMIILVPVLVVALKKLVPEHQLHGYEASYHLEKEQEKKAPEPWYVSIIAGPRLLLTYPYVLGIFFLTSFWGIISIILNCHRLNWCVGETNGTVALSGVLFKQVLWSHVMGLVISLVVVRLCLQYLGERWSLFLVPASTTVLMALYFADLYAPVTSVAYILIRAINYSMAISLREMLYIPTTKEVRFKAKSWTDAFGIKAAGGMGALYAIMTAMGSVHAAPNWVHMAFCGIIMVLWLALAYWLGHRYQHAVAHNEVIGIE